MPSDETPTTPDEIELVEFANVSFAEWVTLTRRDPAPFGQSAAGLQYRPKDHNVGARDGDGRVIGVIGATVVTVSVDGHDPFEVVGVGGLIVHRDARGLGVGHALMKRMTEVVNALGPARAMVLCEAHLLDLYARRGYRRIEDVVWVDQPAGPTILPMAAMWRPVRPASWPAGVVRVHGLPF